MSDQDYLLFTSTQVMQLFGPTSPKQTQKDTNKGTDSLFGWIKNIGELSCLMVKT